MYRFVEPPVLRMSEVVEDSTCKIPLIFVLSTGVVSSIYKHSLVLLYCSISLLLRTPLMHC